MMKRLKRYLIAILFLLSASSPAFSQATITYTYGEDNSLPPGMPAPDSGQNQTLRNGIDMLFGGGTAGIVGGAVGSGRVPSFATSQSRIDNENARAQALLTQRQSLESTYPIDPVEFLKNYNEKKKIDGLVAYKSDKDPNHLRKWHTSDETFKKKAASTLYDIRSAAAKSPEQQQLKVVGERAIELSDSALSVNDIDEASYYYSIARASADLLIGIDPVTGTLRAVYEAITGTNMITGAELTSLERGVAIFGVATLGIGAEISKGVQILGILVSNSVKERAIVQRAVTYGSWIARWFTDFRGSTKSNAVASKYMKMLVEISSGPRRRAEHLKAMYETVETGAMRIHPELYRLDDKFVKNLSLGEATRDEIETLGRAFVGENATVSAYRQDPMVKIFKSVDERYVYRQPIYKKGLKKSQANFEVFAPKESGRTLPLSDSHIDLK